MASSSSDQKQQIVTFEVVPEHCLRNEHLELILGTPINQIIVGIQNVYRSIKNVEFTYCNKEPFGRDITITLRNNGVRLHFDSHRQLLRLIEVFDFKHMKLHYGHTIFSSPDEPADVGKVEKCFGATVPGVYDEKQQKYFLHWQGISFCFPTKETSSSLQTSYAHGLGSLNFASTELPRLELMTIFVGPSPSKMRLPEIPLIVYCANPHLIVAESLNDKDSGQLLGFRVKFTIEDVTERSNDELQLIELERDIFLGDTQQAVMTKLGAPSKIYYKSDDKMLIQRRGTRPERMHRGGDDEDKPDFFFNYFSLGMDLLFDIDSRCLIKFVLHTNVPGHFDFGIYNRCEFHIRAKEHDWAGQQQQQQQNGIGGRMVEIRTESKFEEFRAIFKLPPLQGANAKDAEEEEDNEEEEGEDQAEAEQQSSAVNDAASASAASYSGPVVLNKCCSEGENPFGSTFCYGTDQLIFEVLDNGHIASVVVFDPELID